MQDIEDLLNNPIGEGAFSKEFNNLYSLLEEYAKEAEDLIKKQLERDGRKASGNLIKSVKTEIKIGNLTYSVVLNAEDYLRYLIKGRGKTKHSGEGKVFDNILKWIETKPVLPHPNEQGKLPTNKQLAYLITKKIHEEGFKGTDSIATSLEELNFWYLPRLEEALNKDWGNYSVRIYKGINKMIKIW